MQFNRQPSDYKSCIQKKSKKPQKNNILPHKKKERTNYKTKKFIHKV